MKPLLDWVCKSQKWVENANQPLLKPIIWYTSWYFSRGGKKISRGGRKNSARFARKIKNIYPPPTESLYPPLALAVNKAQRQLRPEPYFPIFLNRGLRTAKKNFMGNPVYCTSSYELRLQKCTKYVRHFRLNAQES